MTRKGKIARLPLDVREELNRRLHEGQNGRAVLAWLNEHPKVKRVLAEDFDGRPINGVNLSGWKNGGYIEWLARQELVERVAIDAKELEAVTDKEMSAHLATVMALHYAALLTTWRGEVTPEIERKLRALDPLCRNILALRRNDLEERRMDLALANQPDHLEAAAALLKRLPTEKQAELLQADAGVGREPGIKEFKAN